MKGHNPPPQLVPKLRFPEFLDDENWVLSTIGKRCVSYSGGTPQTSKTAYYGGKIPFIRSGEIMRDMTELFLTELGLENSAARMVKRGDVLVALYGANSGETALARIDGAINQAILCLRSKDNSEYIYHYLTARKNWITTTYLQGGQGNLSGQIILSVPLILPLEKEQKKIADCLGSLDELITATEQKLEALRQHKRGLMQHLFPQPSETVPQLRFPEFRDTPEWDLTRLTNLAKRITKRNPRGIQLRVLTNSAEHGLVDQREYFDKKIAINTDNYFIVELGDYVYNPRISTIAPVGPISKNRIGKGLISPLYMAFRFNHKSNDYFFYYFKSTHWHDYVQKVSNRGARYDRIAISSMEFLQMPVPTPSRNEQQKIANCLGSLDNLIATSEQKLEALRQHKQGLMQQLFPSLVKI